MTCKCGSEYCWMCLQRWASHNSNQCFTVPESTHELRSSTRNRLHDKAVQHRRQRNQHTLNTLLLLMNRSKLASIDRHVFLSTYIDLNTLAEFMYVVLQRRRIDIDIRSVLSQTARRLANDAFGLKLAIECQQIDDNHLNSIRTKLTQTLKSLIHMKNSHLLV
jgi:hypothetical protein